jgi:primosomal protein N' (replication factor Y)
MVLRMALRMGDNLGPERMRLGVRLVGEPPRRLTPARRRLIEVLSDGLLTVNPRRRGKPASAPA